MIVDIYALLQPEWFEQIGEPSSCEDQYEPLNYDHVCTGLYSANSFYGPEFVDLLVDDEEEIYYIRSAIRQPVGDYAWITIWMWFKSEKSKYAEIKAIIENATENSAIDSPSDNP